jgi:hypothetical protein
LVRPRAASAALAQHAGRDGRSLPGLAQRDHVAADHGQGGAPVLRRVPAPLARCERAGPRRVGRGAWRLGGARLLRPRPQPPCLRPRCGRPAWRQISGRRGRAAQVAGDRQLYRSGHRGDCLRPAGESGRRQYRARGGAPVRRHDAAACGESRDQSARRDPNVGRPAGRLRPSDDGFGCDHLHAAPPGLRSLSGQGRLPGPCRGTSRGAALPRPERGAPAETRCDLRRDTARRRRSAARAAAARPVGRHVGDAVIALGRGQAERKILAQPRPARCGLAQSARLGRAHLHPFSFGA